MRFTNLSIKDLMELNADGSVNYDNSCKKFCKLLKSYENRPVTFKVPDFNLYSSILDKAADKILSKGRICKPILEFHLSQSICSDEINYYVASKIVKKWIQNNSEFGCNFTGTKKIVTMRGRYGGCFLSTKFAADEINVSVSVKFKKVA